MGSAMSQKSLSKTERAPFFCSLCNIDETVLNDDFLSYVFSKARGLNFGMILTSKTLDNIPELVQNGMYGNVSNQLTFRPNSGLSEASRLAQIYNVGGNEILELESNTYFGRLYKKDNSRTDALRISSLWPPVPYWTFKDVEDLIISDSENEN